MSTRQAVTKDAIAAEVWRRMFDFLIATRAQRERVFERFGLTLGDSKVLLALEPGVGQSMGSLAAAWTCDASNVTWMVDRLEHQGLVERRAVADDRRVKMVFLTPLGVTTKAALLEALYEPPPELLELPRADLEALHDAVEKLPLLSRGDK